MRTIYRDTVTVYNRRPAAVRPPFPPPAGETRWDRTVIKGALFGSGRRIRETPEGASFGEQSASVTIPAGSDQGGKTYVGPAVYAGLPEGDRPHWTIRTDKANPDLIILGEGPEISGSYTAADLEREYGDGRLMRPQAVRGDGKRGLPQWKVTGA